MKAGSQKTIQAAADRLYGELYDKISSQQAEAKAQGKHALILAEYHSLNASILETFIYDICERLEIKNLGNEWDKRRNDKYLEDYPFLSLPSFQRKLNFLSKIYESQNHGLNVSFDPFFVVHDIRNHSSQAFDLQSIPVDPLYTKRQEHQRKINESLFDGSILDEVERHLKNVEVQESQKVNEGIAEKVTALATQGDCVCCLGAGHVPYVMQALQAANIPVLPINCILDGDKNKIKIWEEAEQRGIHHPILEREKENNRIVKGYYTPHVDLAPDIRSAEKIRMMLVASVKHQLGKGEITQEEAEERLRLIEQVRKQYSVKARTK